MSALSPAGAVRLLASLCTVPDYVMPKSRAGRLREELEIRSLWPPVQGMRGRELRSIWVRVFGFGVSVSDGRSRAALDELRLRNLGLRFVTVGPYRLRLLGPDVSALRGAWAFVVDGEL